MDWKYLLTSFDGRINRAKFWAGLVVLIAVGIVLGIVNRSFGPNLADPNPNMAGFVVREVVSLIIWLALMYFALAIYAKRWHDRDKSGWWSLIALVPVIGAIWILVELGILEGTRGANQFGPDPLA